MALTDDIKKVIDAWGEAVARLRESEKECEARHRMWQAVKSECIVLEKEERAAWKVMTKAVSDAAKKG